MKLVVDPIMPKSDGPARVEISVNVNELEEGENFDKETMKAIANQLYENEKWHLEHMDMFGHQTFKTIFHFSYNEKSISVSRYPCYTDNF